MDMYLITTLHCEPEIYITYMCVSFSVMSDSLQPHDLSMEFSRQEYWSGLPFPSPGDLPDPEMRARSPTLQADSLLSELQRKPTLYILKENKQNY